MDRAALLEALDVAERHIAEGERHIRQQQEIVARLDRIGRGAAQTAVLAKDLLLSMQRAQRAHLSHRDQLSTQLARLDAVEELSAAETLDWSPVGLASLLADRSEGTESR